MRGAKSSAGWVVDMGELEQRVHQAKESIDHTYLNEVPTLGAPTMENIAGFLWERLADLAGLWKIVVRRDQSKEGCVFHGPDEASP